MGTRAATRGGWITGQQFRRKPGCNPDIDEHPYFIVNLAVNLIGLWALILIFCQSDLNENQTDQQTADLPLGHQELSENRRRGVRLLRVCLQGPEYPH